MKKGSAGPDVEELQRRLAALGYPLKADGFFGSATDSAVRRFQYMNGLLVDGVAGRVTWGCLVGSVVSKPDLSVSPYEQRVLQLDPKLQEPCRALLKKGRAMGLDVRVIQGLRTSAQQLAIWNQGRTTPGDIVTRAPPGYSWHEWGYAFDLGTFAPDADGKIRYLEEDTATMKKLGPVGEVLGLAWGGRWNKPDYPHFQLSGIPATPTALHRKQKGLA